MDLELKRTIYRTTFLKNLSKFSKKAEISGLILEKKQRSGVIFLTDMLTNNPILKLCLSVIHAPICLLVKQCIF